MSYSRFGTHDVYVYMDVNGCLACCACFFDGPGRYDSTQAMVDHLAEHRATGHDLPADIEAALWADDADNFPRRCEHVWGQPHGPSAKTRTPRQVECVRCGWIRGAA